MDSENLFITALQLYGMLVIEKLKMIYGIKI